VALIVLADILVTTDAPLLRLAAEELGVRYQLLP